MLILVVEDDPAVARMIERGLAAHGHRVLVAETGEDGLLFLGSEPVDLVLLDILLPGKDGHQVLAEIRRLRSDLPVIMLTARRDLGSKVAALDGGADDYLTKPFAIEELLARIYALARRADQPRAAALELGDLRVDLAAHRAWRGGREVALSSREFALLQHLARNRGRLLTRQQILSAVWEYDYDAESNVVDVYVRRLRQKLDEPGGASLIATVRGDGYRFDPPAGA